MTDAATGLKHRRPVVAEADPITSSMFYTAPTISFDDLSAREDFLLMLVSTASGSVLQQKKQKRALTILQAIGVQPEILDAADPSNAVIRDELCDLSGMPKGQYPQFFLVQGDQTEFFADFTELEHMNEEGTLAEWLGMEIPDKKAHTEAGDSNGSGSPVVERSPKSMDPPATTKDYFYNQGKNVYDDDGTETTHPETSHAGSSFDSYSIAQSPAPLQVQQHYFDRMDSDEEEGSEVEDCVDQFRNGDQFQIERTCDTTDDEEYPSSPEHDQGGATYSVLPSDSPPRNVPSSPRSPKEESVIHSMISSPRSEVSPGATHQRNCDQLQQDWPKIVATHEDSLFRGVHNSEHGQQVDEDAANRPELTAHSLRSLLSCDESVDTTATASSILTNSRVTSMDLELSIQPSSDIHFLLTYGSEDTPRCTVTLSNKSMSYLPLAFKIQASQRRRYMVWPSVGVVKPQTTVSVTVFLLDDAKQNLLESFQKLGPAAEFRCTDSLSIEWCGVPTNFCNQLTDNHDQDLETLMSYWNSCHKNEGWSCEQFFLRVRVSVDDKEPVPRVVVKESSAGRPQSLSLNASASSSSSFTLAEVEESQKIFQAEVENLRRKCEEMTAERYLLEQQLEDARERQESPSRGGAIHKFQLQQTMRCGHCLKVFRSDANSLRAPIASQSCGHSICRNCCYRRSSANRRRPKHSLSSDLLMCVGDMRALSFDDDSCPVCQSPSAFGGSQLHVNESLCLVLKLLDN